MISYHSFMESFMSLLIHMHSPIMYVFCSQSKRDRLVPIMQCERINVNAGTGDRSGKSVWRTVSLRMSRNFPGWKETLE